MRFVFATQVELACSWRKHIPDAAKRLGWDVKTFDKTTLARPNLLEALEEADLFMWADSVAVNCPWLDRVWKRCRELKVPAFGYAADRYLGIPLRAERIATNQMFKAPLVIGSSNEPKHLRKFKKLGVRYKWMPTACGDGLVGRGKYREELECHVAFVGRGGGGPYRRQRNAIVAFLRERYGEGFRWYGPRADHEPLWGEDVRDLYASASVIVGDQAIPQFRGCWSDRVPIASGQGAVLVQSYVPGFEDEGFVDGKTIQTYNLFDLGSLARAVDRAYYRYDESYEIANRAMVLVQERHTWVTRLTDMAEAVM